HVVDCPLRRREPGDQRSVLVLVHLPILRWARRGGPEAAPFAVYFSSPDGSAISVSATICLLPASSAFATRGAIAGCRRTSMVACFWSRRDRRMTASISGR